jgi:hypothetical protein
MGCSKVVGGLIFGLFVGLAYAVCLLFVPGLLWPSPPLH